MENGTLLSFENGFSDQFFKLQVLFIIPTSDDDDVVVSTEDVPGTDHFVSRIAYCIQSIPC